VEGSQCEVHVESGRADEGRGFLIHRTQMHDSDHRHQRENRLSAGEAFGGIVQRGRLRPPCAVTSSPSAECLYVDLTIDESVQRGLQAICELHGNRLVSVIHLAAYYEFSGAPSPLYDRITVGGTEWLLRFLQDFEVEQFIFSSGELVHAPSELGQNINEDAPLAAKWPYPESKVKTERVIHTGRRT